MKKRRIIYVQYTNPAAYPPLEHSSRILANAGWEILFLGIQLRGKANILRFPPHPSITVHQLPTYNTGWQQKLHYIYFILWVLLWILYWRPACVYASDPYSCPIALLISYFPSIKVIYHEHDSPEKSTANLSKFMQLVLWSRTRLAQRCTCCLLPNEKRTKVFLREVTTDQPVLTVWNCPRCKEVRQRRNLKKDQKIFLYYHGNIGPSYVPITVLKAMATLPAKLHLRIIGYETTSTHGHSNQIKREARRLDLENRIEILNAIPSRDQLLKECGKCDIGLAFAPKKDQGINNLYKVGASNKPFDYLACGLALLVSDLPSWQATYVDPGYGLSCNPEDPESISTALQWFLHHPEKMRRMGERGRQRILKEWNYERQFFPVLEYLDGER